MATWDFTENERHQIDVIAHKMNNSETLTTDETLLYARFEAYKAVRNAEFEAEQARRDERNQALIEECRLSAQTARDNLNSMASQAMERYERTLTNV